ncbi:MULTISPECIES: lytic polysaccharide monooxygenase [Clostridia]|uniref:lytic polysaccharide monooxygenase n=1 Tax=Clostridia TaxID=186801 RepID=UPI000EA2011E|nr:MULTISPECIES: lytic polysaccharide monooxygenase [Clostridia]NBJ70640.1 chitin-binding protein [Roseburia sp. 1XD42-34]RKI75945.1 chitin-binding protein [Clostridium sp. 1xD42-85]
MLRVSRSRTLVFISSIFIAFIIMLVFSNEVSAHGYVDSPKSRALLCKEGTNSGCGAVTYEPQSVEGPGDFPSVGAPDGKIASGGSRFFELDQQSPTRWAKNPIKSEMNTFTWTITAPHATEKWDYYITKEGWDPNQPLKRSDLELFCSVNDGGKVPGFKVSHNCSVPKRTGYHVILAYWEIQDTTNAFYSVIDVDFGGNSNIPTEPPADSDKIPTWDPSQVYVSGNKASYNGSIYQAKWWVKNEKPDQSPAWELISEGLSDKTAEDNRILPWDPNKIYLSGDKVVYNNIVYQAKWWTQGNTPDSNIVWEISA